MLASLSDFWTIFPGTSGSGIPTGSILLSLSASSEEIEQACGRTFGATASFTDTWDGDGGYAHTLRYQPASSVTSVSVGFSAVSESVSGSSGWVLNDGTVELVGYLFSPGTANCLVTYVAGYGAVPAVLKKACLDYAFLKWLDADKAGTSQEGMGGQTYTRLPSMRPQSVQTAIDLYKRWSI